VVRTEALAGGAVEVAILGGVIVGGTIWYPPRAHPRDPHWYLFAIISTSASSGWNR
jgi:hypothetical protein